MRTKKAFEMFSEPAIKHFPFVRPFETHGLELSKHSFEGPTASVLDSLPTLWAMI